MRFFACLCCCGFRIQVDYANTKTVMDVYLFIALVEKYENFDTMTTTMLNEFVEKILLHERDRGKNGMILRSRAAKNGKIMHFAYLFLFLYIFRITPPK